MRDAGNYLIILKGIMSNEDETPIDLYISVGIAINGVITILPDQDGKAYMTDSIVYFGKKVVPEKLSGKLKDEFKTEGLP